MGFTPNYAQELKNPKHVYLEVSLSDWIYSPALVLQTRALESQIALFEPTKHNSALDLKSQKTLTEGAYSKVPYKTVSVNS